MLDESTREDLIEKIKAIFTNEADAEAFNEDPDGYVAEHLPEGTEGGDVAACLPEVGVRTGLDFSNVAHAGGGSAAAQLSHTYTTIYQQNAFIYAEEGAQVTNIQGDGNAVAQQDIDIDVDVDLDDEDYGEGDGEDYPEEPTDEYPEESVDDPMDPVEEPVDEPVEEPVEEPVDELPEELPEEPVETPTEEAPEVPEEPEVPDGAEAL